MKSITDHTLPTYVRWAESPRASRFSRGGAALDAYEYEGLNGLGASEPYIACSVVMLVQYNHCD
jgi:hypothetical protein